MSRIAAFAVALLPLAAPAFAESACPHAITPVDKAAIYRAVSANAEAVAPSSKRRSVAKGEGPTLAVVNFIDAQISAKLKRDHVLPTVIAGDEEFLRRVTLDLTGTIPAAADVQAFLADTSADKRTRKIDALLASDAFADRWTMWFGDLVQNVQISNNSREYYLGRNVYYTWIRDSIRANKPYDQMVRELIAGAGDNFTSGPANYAVRQLQRNGPPQDTYDNLASHSAEKFLAIPMLCISCHNGMAHLESVNRYLRGKSRNDFWRMAAFFSRTQLKATQYVDPNNANVTVAQYTVGNNTTGVYRLNTTDGNKSPRIAPPDTPQTVTPAFLTTGEVPREGEAYRTAYGRMLTADRQFARAAVNYIWKEMFGLGIVEPANAFDLSQLATQPTHPALLEELTDSFIASGYNLRTLLRTIAGSNTYQLSSRYAPGGWNESWVPYFARRYPRRMQSEVLFDAIASATALPGAFNVQGIGIVSKAMQLPDPLDGRRTAPSLFLDQFGRGDRDDTARTNDSSISQSLAMLNDAQVVTRVRRATRGSTVQQVLTATTDPASIVDRLYLATLSRRPTAEEKQTAIDYLRAGEIAARTEDLQFVLLNTLEFSFQ
ncbi:MAG: DUF1549 and DUF1553 domain-containing protein [Acidobacteriota bacterium]|nr:DUF1549 and DUF1553 domain-containing protein [Acidobacteriota bacterium]